MEATVFGKLFCKRFTTRSSSCNRWFSCACRAFFVKNTLTVSEQFSCLDTWWLVAPSKMITLQQQEVAIWSKREVGRHSQMGIYLVMFQIICKHTFVTGNRFAYQIYSSHSNNARASCGKTQTKTYAKNNNVTRVVFKSSSIIRMNSLKKKMKQHLSKGFNLFHDISTGHDYQQNIQDNQFFKAFPISGSYNERHQ